MDTVENAEFTDISNRLQNNQAGKICGWYTGAYGSSIFWPEMRRVMVEGAVKYTVKLSALPRDVVVQIYFICIEE